MTTNIDRAAEVIFQARIDAPPTLATEDFIARRLAEAGLLMPDIPDGLNLVGFERRGGGGGLLWDDRITPAALTKGYVAMFARLDKKEKK